MTMLRILLLALAAALAPAQTEPAVQPSAPPASPAPSNRVGLTDADIAARIAALEAVRPRYLNDKGEPADEAALTRLDDAIARLRAVPGLLQEDRALGAEADGAAAQVTAFQAELDTPLPGPESLLPGADADLAALEEAQRSLDEKLQAVRARIDSIGRQAVERAARTEAIPGELTTARAMLDDAEDRLVATGALTAAETDPNDPRRAIDEALRDYAQVLIGKLETERRFLSAVAPRHDLRARLAEREAAQLTKAKELFVARIADARQRAAARQQAESRRTADEVAPELQPLAERVLDLTRENTRLVARLNVVESELASTRATAQAVAARDAQIRSRASGSPGGLQIGQLLLRAREALPDPALLRTEATRILRETSALEDRAFELQTLLDLRPTTDGEIRDALRSDYKIARIDDSLLAAATALYAREDQTARDLLVVIDGPGRLVQQSHELAAAKSELALRIESLERFIDARILWIRSDPAITRVSPKTALKGFLPLASHGSWAALWKEAKERPGFLITATASGAAALMLALALYIWLGRRLRAINQMVQMPSTDRFWLTLVALGLLAARSALAPGLMVGLSRLFGRLETTGLPLASWCSAGLARAAYALLLGSFLLGLVRPGGIGETHFRWPRPSTASVRRHLRWFTIAIVLLAFTVAGARASREADALIMMRFAALAGHAMMVVFFGLLLRPHGPLMKNVVQTSVWRGWRIAWPVMYLLVVGAFVALGVLHALGWSFSAASLARRLFDSALVVALIVLARAVMLRWLAIARRRLAFEQHRKLLEAMKEQAEQAQQTGADRPGGPATDEEDMINLPVVTQELDLSSIQRQTRQLVALGAWTLGILLVLPIWRDVVPALQRIDDIRLLPISIAAGEDIHTLRENGRFVLSLADLLGAMLAAFVGTMAVRNVPPLFDGFVLSRTRLDIGARYAATTLARYALLAVAVFLVLTSLGFTGKSLGWAIAGLSVGLGLGLQSFVGNLVAGLSLLFERSVRPGDRVIVGNVEGVVKSISIRATILTDFDRRDVVIPNSKLIADTVINETRSDITGRAIIAVGVAYGSDTRLVERLLLETVRKHPQVQDVLSTFDNFGDNALNFTLRVYIADVTERLATVNELHHSIAEVFRQNDIEISFPQRDLHIRDGALEVRLTDGRSSSSA